MGKVIENSILESAYHNAIIHPSLITKLCELAKVPIRENKEKCPPMQPLQYPKKRTTHPTRRRIPRRGREENERREDENRAEVEVPNSEEGEVEREPLQAQVDLIAERMSGLA